MPVKAQEDPRLIRISEIALGLPEVARVLHPSDSGSHAQFLVRKKTFAYYLDNHHGDGIVAIACKVLAGDNESLAASQPDKFYLPAYLASRGWVALRLDRGRIGWTEVRELLATSYSLVAPRRLADRLKVDSSQRD